MQSFVCYMEYIPIKFQINSQEQGNQTQVQ